MCSALRVTCQKAVWESLLTCYFVAKRCSATSVWPLEKSFFVLFFLSAGKLPKRTRNRFPPLPVCFDPSDTLLTAGWRGRGRRRARGGALALCVREDTHGSRRKGLGEEELRSELKNQQNISHSEKINHEAELEQNVFSCWEHFFVFVFWELCTRFATQTRKRPSPTAKVNKNLLRAPLSLACAPVRVSVCVCALSGAQLHFHLCVLPTL